MAISNAAVAAVFDELADLLEIQDANPFRVRAYRNAARTLRGLGPDLNELLNQGKDLTELPDIGKDLAEKIKEILATGTCAALLEVHKAVPPSLGQLLKIPALGPKRVKALFRDLGIQDLAELEQAARAGRLRELPGFGAKTEQHILEVIAAHRDTGQRFTLAAAAQHAEPLLAYLKTAPGVRRVVAAGSYRRGRETVGDLDILVTATGGSPVMDRFVAYGEVLEVVSKGTTRATVVLRSGLQVDLRVVAAESFGAALHYFTGSKAHNIQVRRLGQQRGLKINEYGVFEDERRVAGDTEESVFAAVGLPYIPPELREARGEIEAARGQRLPQLLTRADLRGDLHVHTRASDGRAPLHDMVRAAQQQGLRYIAITDHSPHLTVAHGLSPARLARQMEEIERLNADEPGITVLKGVEVDILEDGSLDLPDAVLAQLDLVIGAVHSHFGLSRVRQTERILRAMDHRYFSILAHPTGRLLGERDAYEVDMGRLIRHARERGCFLELDAQPKRLDMNDIDCLMAKQEGVLIALDSDAHGVKDFEHLHFGVSQARRGWLEKHDVLNTRPLRELRRLLRQTMG